MIDDFFERFRCKNFDARNKRRFARVFFWDEHRYFPLPLCFGNKREYSPHGAQSPVKREFTDKKILFWLKADIIRSK
jgi:hypothetical protein